MIACRGNITHRQQKKRESYGILFPRDSPFCFIVSVLHLHYKCIGPCLYPYSISPKRTSPIGVILLSEYHASSIRLCASIFRQRRNFCLRSDIRLAPSGIRFASFRANRIPLKPQGFNITIAVAIISLFAKAKYITKKAEKERVLRNFVSA